ncbi:MAG TPA: hypothetical protein VK864_00960, partial [Longimicrobiales bacterium]|nr:hypothetical protein [Longimicrobiales bacterium]
MLNSALTRYVLVIALTAVGAPLPAQDTTRVPTGVRLSTVYRPMKRPVLAVQPFAGASQVSDIVRRDLDYSDRFEVVETPQALAAGAVDYSQWSSLSVIFVVAGTVNAEGNGSRLAITVHDVPFGRVKETQSFSLPAANAPNFRMAVHAISDELVRRLTGQPGSAASRIVFTRQAGAGSELMIVDSDGENLQRLFSSPLWIYSPVLSPRGDRVAYAVRARNSRVELHERDLATGADRAISSRAEVSFTPAYSPDGKRLVFAFSTGLGMEIHEYDVEKRCCLRRVTNGPRSDLAPSFSGDGR